MMKVLLIRARAADSAIFKVAESLSKNGFDVELLVWDRKNNLETQNGQNYKIKKFSLKSPYDTWMVYFFIPIWWLFEFYYILTSKADIVHACDIDTLLPAVFAKYVKKYKFFYTIYDFYANSIPHAKPYFLTDAARNIIGNVEKAGIGHADILFLVDECRLEEVKGASIKHVVYIYNSPPDCNIQPLKSDGKRFTIFYAGPYHRTRGLEFVIDAIKDIDNVYLEMAGLVMNDLKLTEESKKKVILTGWIPSYDDLLKKTLIADLLFRFEDPILPRSKYASPNKLFESMLCSKPIMVNSEIGASKIVEEEKCGITVRYGDVQAIKESIIRLRDDPGLQHEMGRNGRKAYETKYSWAIMEKRLIDAYNGIFS